MFVEKISLWFILILSVNTKFRVNLLDFYLWLLKNMILEYNKSCLCIICLTFLKMDGFYLNVKNMAFPEKHQQNTYVLKIPVIS